MGTEAAEKEFQSPYFHLANRTVDTKWHKKHQDQIQEVHGRLPGPPGRLGCAPQPFQRGLWGTTAGSSFHHQEHKDLSSTLMNTQHLTHTQQERDLYVVRQLLFFWLFCLAGEGGGKTFVKPDSPSKPTGRTCHHSASLDVCLPMPKWLRSYQRMTSRSWSTQTRSTLLAYNFNKIGQDWP